MPDDGEPVLYKLLRWVILSGDGVRGDIIALWSVIWLDRLAGDLLGEACREERPRLRGGSEILGGERGRRLLTEGVI